MLVPKHLAALSAALPVAGAAFQGFNYGNKFADGTIKLQADYETEFKAAASLKGTDGAFTSARLYTMIQPDTDNEPIQAIPAALVTDTSLLLGLWASVDDADFEKELAALRRAVERFAGKGLQLAGISVGSEDLYRISPTGIKNGEFRGLDPNALVRYVGRVREVVRGTEFAATPVGHVDTWTAWVNGSNAAVVDAVDWIGVDAYAYWEDTRDNAVANGGRLFDDAVGATRNAVGASGKEIWITETGWPVSGSNVGAAEASPENAKMFWDDVGCGKLFGKVSTWWYTFQDAKGAAAASTAPSFGVVGGDPEDGPLYDLSCSGSTSPNSTAKVTGTTTRTSTHTSTRTSNGAVTGTVTGTTENRGRPGNTGTAGGSGSDAPPTSTVAPPPPPTTTPSAVPGAAAPGGVESALALAVAGLLVIAFAAGPA